MLYADNDKRVEDNKKEWLYLSRIYAHGTLEQKLGYDILVTKDIEVYNDIYNYHHENDMFIRESKAENSEGNIYDVKMYLWKNDFIDKWSGLVCLKDDVESNKYALKQYESKVQCL